MGHAYLDHFGAGLYHESQIRDYSEQLRNHAICRYNDLSRRFNLTINKKKSIDTLRCHVKIETVKIVRNQLANEINEVKLVSGLQELIRTLKATPSTSRRLRTYEPIKIAHCPDISVTQKSSSAALSDIALEVEKTIRSVAPSLKRVIKYRAPTFQGHGDVITIGVWSKFVAVGFWNGAKLASRYHLLEGSARTSRIAKIRTLSEAKSKTFKDLIKAAVKLDVTDPVHRK
jgi:hypothetical protein